MKRLSSIFYASFSIRYEMVNLRGDYSKLNLWSYYECSLSKFCLEYSLPIDVGHRFKDFNFESSDLNNFHVFSHE